MDLLKIFRSDHEGIRRSHVKNLISIAMADGRLEPEEWEMLSSIAKIMSISDADIAFIKVNPERVAFDAPKRYEDKVQQLQDLVAVMTIDGDINPGELELCKKIALRLDILPQFVDEIITASHHRSS